MPLLFYVLFMYIKNHRGMFYDEVKQIEFCWANLKQNVILSQKLMMVNY